MQIRSLWGGIVGAYYRTLAGLCIHHTVVETAVSRARTDELRITSPPAQLPSHDCPGEEQSAALSILKVRPWTQALQSLVELLRCILPPTPTVRQRPRVRVWGLKLLGTVPVHTLFKALHLPALPEGDFFLVLSPSADDPTHFHFKCLTAKMSSFLVKNSQVTNQQRGHRPAYKGLLTHLVLQRGSDGQITWMWFVSNGDFSIFTGK